MLFSAFCHTCSSISFRYRFRSSSVTGFIFVWTMNWSYSDVLVLRNNHETTRQSRNFSSLPLGISCSMKSGGLIFDFPKLCFGMDILYANMTYKCGNIPSELLWWYSLPWAKWSCPFYGGASLLSSLSRDFPHNH